MATLELTDEESAYLDFQFPDGGIFHHHVFTNPDLDF